MAVKILNDVRSKLSVSIGATDTQVRVIAGHGVRFPVLDTAGDWFPLALENESGQIEYLRATARNGDVITVVRAQEGSLPRGYGSGAVCELRLTVAALQAFIEQNGGGGGGGSSNLTTINVSDGQVA